MALHYEYEELKGSSGLRLCIKKLELNQFLEYGVPNDIGGHYSALRVIIHRNQPQKVYRYHGFYPNGSHMPGSYCDKVNTLSNMLKIMVEEFKLNLLYQEERISFRLPNYMKYYSDLIAYKQPDLCWTLYTALDESSYESIIKPRLLRDYENKTYMDSPIVTIDPILRDNLDNVVKV